MNQNKPNKHGRFSLGRLLEWLDPKLFVMLILIALFMTAMAYTEPSPSAHKVSGLAKADVPLMVTPPDSAQAGPTLTPIPAEWATNREMGRGIVLGAIVLVLIIVGGTLMAIRRKG